MRHVTAVGVDEHVNLTDLRWPHSQSIWPHSVATVTILSAVTTVSKYRTYIAPKSIKESGRNSDQTSHERISALTWV